MQTLSTVYLFISVIYLSTYLSSIIYLSSICLYLSIYLQVCLSIYLPVIVYLSIIISLASICMYLSIYWPIYLSISPLILSLTSIENFTKYTASVELNLLFCLAIRSFTHSSLTSHLLSVYYMEVPFLMPIIWCKAKPTHNKYVILGCIYSSEK